MLSHLGWDESWSWSEQWATTPVTPQVAGWIFVKEGDTALDFPELLASFLLSSQLLNHNTEAQPSRPCKTFPIWKRYKIMKLKQLKKWKGVSTLKQGLTSSSPCPFHRNQNWGKMKRQKFSNFTIERYWFFVIIVHIWIHKRKVTRVCDPWVIWPHWRSH